MQTYCHSKSNNNNHQTRNEMNRSPQGNYELKLSFIGVGRVRRGVDT